MTLTEPRPNRGRQAGPEVPDTRTGVARRVVPRSRARLARTVVGALVAAGLSACALLSPNQTKALTALNADRTFSGRSILFPQGDAQAKAQAWADKLARENALYHSNLADGIHVQYCSLGENVGFSDTVANVERAFMGSSGHRTNILDPKWNGVGVGVARNGSRAWIVQVFIQTC